MQKTPKKSVGAPKKRQQISDSARTMFLWVAGMSVVSAFCLVLTWFMIQQITFRGRVIDQKRTAASQLEQNVAAVDELRKNIRVLETNSTLREARASDDEKALQVVLDALPSDANTTALGASIQERIVADIDGLSVEALSVDPVGASQIQTADGVSEAAPTEESTSDWPAIPFRMTVRANSAGPLRELLSRFERSIRAVSLSSLSLERSENDFTMNIEGMAYYQPAKSVDPHECRIVPDKEFSPEQCLGGQVSEQTDDQGGNS